MSVPLTKNIKKNQISNANWYGIKGRFHILFYLRANPWPSNSFIKNT